MRIILFVTLLAAVNVSRADEVRCDGLVPLEAVEEICAVVFVRGKARERESRCNVRYRVSGFEGISPELVFNTDSRVDSNSQHKAPTYYSSSLESDRKSGRLKEELSGIGEAAFYSEFDIHMVVKWHDGEAYHQLDVMKGRAYEEEWKPACEKEQIVQIAEIINESL
jgi:hypothetical protein